MAQPPAQELPYPSCHPLLGVGNHHSPDSPHQQGAQLSHPHDRLKQTHPHLAPTSRRDSWAGHNPSPRPFRILWGTQHSTQESDIRRALHAVGQIPESASIRKTVRKLLNSTAWWFTISAEEEYISIVDLHWAQISQDPRWVLLKWLKDRPRHSAVKTTPQAVHAKPHHQPVIQESQPNSAIGQEKAAVDQSPPCGLPYPSVQG